MIRTNKIPFLQSRASWPLLTVSALIVGVGITLPFTALGRFLGFVGLPGPYWGYLAATVTGYVVLTQLVKVWLLRRRWI